MKTKYKRRRGEEGKREVKKSTKERKKESQVSILDFYAASFRVNISLGPMGQVQLLARGFCVAREETSIAVTFGMEAQGIASEEGGRVYWFPICR